MDEQHEGDIILHQDLVEEVVRGVLSESGASGVSRLASVTVVPADVPSMSDRDLVIHTPAAGDLIYDILEGIHTQWNGDSVANIYNGDPDTGRSMGNEGNTSWSADFSPVDGDGAKSYISLMALTGGSSNDFFPIVSTGAPITLRMYADNNNLLPITALSQGGKTFTLDGDVHSLVPASVEVYGSTGNDGIYTRVSSTYNGGTDKTTVTVSQAIPSAVADGSIVIAIPTAGLTRIIVLGIPA